MAFVDSTDPNAQDPNQQNQNGGQGPVSLGGSAGGLASGGSAGGSGPAAPAAQKPSSSGSYTNLQSYIDANQEQAAKMGSDVAGNLSGEAQKASDAITKDQNDFSSQVGQSGASLATDQSNIDRILGNPTSANDADVKSFQNDLNGQYSGPKSITESGDWSDVAGAANKAAQDVGNTQSEAGRDLLLQKQYARGDYGAGSGMNKLDQMLVAGNKDAQSSLQGVNNQWGGITDNLNNAVTQSGQAAQQRIADTAAANDYAKTQLGTANANLQTGLQTQLASTQAKNAADYANAQQAISGNEYTPDQLKAFGLTAGENTYGADASQFLHQGPAATVYNSATADQYAQAAALAKLAGQSDSSYLPGADAAQAGTASPYSFDQAGFQTAAANAKGGLQDQINQFMTQSYYPVMGPGNYNDNMTVDNFNQNFPGLIANDRAANMANDIAIAQDPQNIAAQTSAIAHEQALEQLTPQWQGIMNAINQGQVINQAAPAAAVSDTGAGSPIRKITGVA